jgi:hypothetical protein
MFHVRRRLLGPRLPLLVAVAAVLAGVFASTAIQPAATHQSAAGAPKATAATGRSCSGTSVATSKPTTARPTTSLFMCAGSSRMTTTTCTTPHDERPDQVL